MSSDLVKQAAMIVESYVSNNEVPPQEVTGLLSNIYGTLVNLSDQTVSISEESTETAVEAADKTEKSSGSSVASKSVAAVKPKPFVPVDEAVSHSSVICLLCGKACSALKGHLTRSHSMSVDIYRDTFDLPKNFPMVSPEYSAKRRKLAIDAGLGDKLREAREKKKNTDS
ncbi:MAG: MucR family transcriptional regulator [Magnetococcales bacterium]|nr:MucR family transcriptional regulator [Magnetococcales bacterium]